MNSNLSNLDLFSNNNIKLNAGLVNVSPDLKIAFSQDEIKGNKNINYKLISNDKVINNYFVINTVTIKDEGKEDKKNDYDSKDSVTLDNNVILMNNDKAHLKVIINSEKYYKNFIVSDNTLEKDIEFMIIKINTDKETYELFKKNKNEMGMKKTKN